MRRTAFVTACAAVSLLGAVVSDTEGQALDTTRAQAGGAALQRKLSPVTMRIRSAGPGHAGIGEPVWVEIDSLQEAIKRDRVDPQNFVLYLNGRPLWNVRGVLVDPKRGMLEFRLERADTSQEAWVALLGSPNGLVKPGVSVGAGYDGGTELESIDLIPPHLTLTVVKPWFLTTAAIVLVLLGGGFLWLVRKSNIIRDSSPPLPPAGFRKPYSLARLQMAVWFFLVLGAFIFLDLITDSTDTLNQQALILIGIGTGTALGAALVDNSKRAVKESRLADLRPLRARLRSEIQQLETSVPLSAASANSGATSVADSPTVQVAEKRSRLESTEADIKELEQSQSSPVSAGFFSDILSDNAGISFHRFQMLAWTVILGLVFVYSVWERLAMPQFSATLLSLMGISAGTYLGFKVPEKEG